MLVRVGVGVVALGGALLGKWGGGSWRSGRTSLRCLVSALRQESLGECSSILFQLSVGVCVRPSHMTMVVGTVVVVVGDIECSVTDDDRDL